MNIKHEEQKQSPEESDIHEKINFNMLQVRMVIKNKDLNMEQKKKKLSDIIVESLQKI